MNDSTPPSSSSTSPKAKTPLCADLSSKKLNLSGGIAFSAEDVLDAAAHCWCARTYKVLGPDRDIAHPEVCGTQRGCYRAPGSPRPND